MQLLGLFDAAIRSPGGQPRSREIHAAAQKLVFEQRQVRCDFAGHLVFGTVAGDKIVDFANRRLKARTLDTVWRSITWLSSGERSGPTFAHRRRTDSPPGLACRCQKPVPTVSRFVRRSWPHRLAWPQPSLWPCR